MKKKNIPRFFHTFSKVCFFPLDVLLDCIFGALRPPLDSSWPLLGTSWTQLGAHLAPLGLHLGGLGRLLASIWGLLGASWGQLCPLGLNFGPPERSWSQFWCLLGTFGDNFEGLAVLLDLLFGCFFLHGFCTCQAEMGRCVVHLVLHRVLELLHAHGACNCFLQCILSCTGSMKYFIHTVLTTIWGCAS